MFQAAAPLVVLRCRKPNDGCTSINPRFSVSHAVDVERAETNLDGSRSEGGGEKGENGTSGGEFILLF